MYRNQPPVYLVKDDHGEILEGTFYAEEIQKVSFSVCEILPHLGFQCSVKTFNDTGFGLLVVSGKEVYVVFLEKLLKYSVGKFSSRLYEERSRRMVTVS
jgi:hypothetical protein